MTKAKTKIETAPIEGVTVLKAHALSASLKGTRNTGLSSESFLNFLNFKRLVDGISAKRDEDLKILFDGYNIKTSLDPIYGGHVYNFKKHPNEKDIQDKLDAINNATVELKNTNFMTPDEFYEFTKRMDMDQIEVMAKFLLKETNSKK